MEKLTEQQIDDLKYFWWEKGDLERWCDFEKLKPQIEKEFPRIIYLWEEHKSCVKMLNVIMDSI